MMFSPLDQFKIAPIFSVNLFGFDFSITNFLIIALLNLFIIKSLIFALKSKDQNNLFVAPFGWQLILENFYTLIANLLADIITTSGEKYLQIMIFLFMFIVTNNLIGLIPFSFTVTSHITVTFFLSLSIFIALNIIGFNKHGFNLFSLFLPSNTGFFLALLLVPIELVSYIAKPVSLGVRLFINLMAGHSLLKVIAWFSWNILLLENIKALVFLVPLAILVILMGLELGVALIQAYVFVTLTAIYLNDVEELH